MKYKIKRWFGEGNRCLTNEEFYITVSVLAKLNDAFEKRTLTFTNKFQADYLGQADPLFSVRIGPGFWDLPARSRASTVLHEFTHKYAALLDLAYFDEPLGHGTGPPKGVKTPTYYDTSWKKQVFLSSRFLIRNADTYAGFLQEFYLK